ncbi:MAG: hypothetical protein H6698_00915 [Myxococcales bacterium]|nr:hypothetical protein [Myxococcales bacterium]
MTAWLGAPAGGARLRLVLESGTETHGRYAGTVAWASGEAAFRATVERAGTVTLDWDDAPQDWIERAVTSVARSLTKGASWPRRITRWKEGA